MKWTLKNMDSKKSVSPLHNSFLSRRSSSTSLLISALLRYSLKRRKYESLNKMTTQGGEDQRVPCRDGIPARSERIRQTQAAETCKTPRSDVITKKTLISLQTQLAILSDADGDRPIHIAVANGNLHLVQKLCHLMMKNSISLDITNHLKQTPLHLAVIIGNGETIKYLLKCGASPLICDRNGNSVLHLAVKSNYKSDVIDSLLSHAQVKTILNSIDYEGYSALHYAVSRNNAYAVEVLQASGADVNKTDGKSGRTALIHAVLDKNASMVELLLKLGACPKKADYSGQNAFDLSLQTANAQIVGLLQKRTMSQKEASLREEKQPQLSDDRVSSKRTKK